MKLPGEARGGSLLAGTSVEATHHLRGSPLSVTAVHALPRAAHVRQQQVLRSGEDWLASQVTVTGQASEQMLRMHAHMFQQPVLSTLSLNSGEVSPAAEPEPSAPPMRSPTEHLLMQVVLYPPPREPHRPLAAWAVRVRLPRATHA